MRRWLAFAWLLCSPSAWAALQADTAWEIRPANGADTNGACYDTGGAGTDYSKQNGAELSLTDLAQTLSSTTLTSATGGFTSAMVDNCIRISAEGTGPFTLAYYEITAFTNTNTVTLDRTACSTANCSGGTGAVGGAGASFEGPATNDISDSLVAGNKVWVKNEAWNEAVVLTVDGTAAAPIVIEGYNTSRGDLDFDPSTWANRPTNDRANAAGVGITLSGLLSYQIKYIRVTRAGGDGFGFITTGLDDQFIGCRADLCGGDGFDGIGTNSAIWLACEADNNTGRGINNASVGPVISCYLHDNTNNGVQAPNRGLFSSIIDTNSADGIAGTTAMGEIVGNTVDGNTGAATDGLACTTPGGGVSVWINNIFSNNGNYGVNATDGDSVWADYNNYDSNVSGARNNFPTGPNDQALASQFTGRAAGDFSIGTNLKALGFPGVFPGALSTGYVDIGAVQRQEAGGASAYTWVGSQ